MEGRPDLGFDLAAASLRADEPELARAIEIFAAKLESALPSASRVKHRQRWPVFGRSRATSLDVTLGDLSYRLSSTRSGVVAERTERVHDMSRRTETLSVADWLASLEKSLREQAETSSEARRALDELLAG